MSAFLVGRTIRGKTRKVLMLAKSGSKENGHAIKRSMGKWYCLLKGERLEEPRSGHPDHWLSLERL